MFIYKYNPGKKHLLALLVLLIAGSLAGQVSAQGSSKYGDYPYVESLLQGGAGNGVVAVDAAIEDPNHNGIQLTPALTNQFGAIYIDSHQFGATNGITVEFEYDMYGGRATGTATGPGDGLSMFLYDATVNLDHGPNQLSGIGAPGAGLGYAYRWASDRNKDIKGLEGAYLGVGFDLFGNFRALRFEGSERVSGVPFGNILTPRENYGTNSRDHVTLRGAHHKTGFTVQSRTFDTRTSGYPVLISRSTQDGKTYILNDEYRVIGSNNINTDKGFREESSSPLGFSIAGQYRKAIVELFPALDKTEGGFYVSVSIQTSSGTVFKVIEDYHYKEKIYYHENASRTITGNPNSPSGEAYLKDLDAKVPDALKVGFAASTGDGTNIHIIRNVKLSLPRAAEAKDDQGSTYSSTPLNIPVLTNDLAYDGIIAKVQQGKAENIDPATFRFVRANDRAEVNPQTGIVEIDDSADLGTGVWRYDLSTKQVTFTPMPGFTGTATISYDIKGKADPSPGAGDYADEAYRSLPATITVEVIQAPFKNVITNKHVTSRGK